MCYGDDNFGRLRSADDGHWPLGCGYDLCERLIQEHQGFGSQYYDYDEEGNLNRMRLVDGNLVDIHYRQERLFQMVHNGQILTEHGWHHGQEITRRQGQGDTLKLRSFYDSRHRLVCQWLTAAEQEGSLLRRDWEYDPAGL